MKRLKLSVLLSLLSLVALCAHGQGANRLVIPDLTVQSGKDVQIPVKVDNTEEIVAIQFDLTLPEGISVSPDVTLTDRSVNHKITARSIGDNTLRVMSYSSDNSAIRGNSGTLLYINAHISESLPEGTAYPMLIDGAVLSVKSGNNVLNESVAGNITVAQSPDLAVSDVRADKQAIAPGDTVNVSWTVANVGGLSTDAGWKEQIHLVSGQTSKLIGTAYHEDVLAAGGQVNRMAVLQIPAIVGLDGEVFVEIKLTPYSGSGEPVSVQANNTARSASALSLAKVLDLTVPASIQETQGSAVRCMLSRSGDTSADGVFALDVTHADARVSAPASVTISKGQPSVYFYLTVNDNDEIDDNDTVALSVSGEGYDAVSATITVIDDEIPSLSLSASPETITEGDELTLTISAERAPKTDLTINLYCDAARRFRLPSAVTLPAGAKEVTVKVQSIDDQEVQSEESPLFKAAAEGFETAQAVITLLDNDLPEIQLTVTPTVVSESAGYYAIMAKLTRLSKTENRVTVKLSDTSAGKLAYPASIVLEKGISVYEFNIGVNDNSVVDGDEDILLTAAVYISSCDCTSAGTSGGSVSQTITVLDNDGPSLSVVASTATWLEGSKGQLTITRNTAADSPLTVTLSSDNDGLIEYEHTAVIPAGTASVQIPVTVKANDTTSDSSTIVFTAEADGHSKGKCWVMISDQSLPDANVTAVTLDTDKAEVGTKVTASVTLKNDGVIPMPAQTKVNVYMSNASEPAATLWTQEPLLPGAEMTLDASIDVPSLPGSYSVTAAANEERAFAELSYVNNRSLSASLSVIGAFTATVSADRSIYLPGDTIRLTGRATGNKASNAEVEIYLINSGRHTVKAVTDADGNFSAEWTPYPQQSGRLSIGACYPGENLSTEMASADIHGLRVSGNPFITCRALIGETFKGSFKLVNGSSLPLTGVTATVDGVPEYCTIDISCPSGIDGSGTATVEFSIDASAISEGTDWEYISVDITTAEGLKVPVTLCYYCFNTKGTLKSDVQAINTTMTKGSSRDYQFIVTNVGKGETGRISLDLPGWMQSVTPKVMPSMAPGDSATVVLRFTPTDDMPLNLTESGALSMVCDNGNGLTLPFRIEVVSESTGTLTVDICDENTYYSPSGPHVQGATVEVRHPITGAHIATGHTDESGKCSFVLPEGYYTIDATADKHHAYNGINVLVDPGKETVKTVNLSLAKGVNFDFQMERIEIEDGYELTFTSANFQVDVPVPVVELSLPSNLNIDDMSGGESVIINAALTNKGLIIANDAVLTLPSDIPGVTFESLLDEDRFDISPQQSIFIPIKVTKLKADPLIEYVVKYPCTVTFTVVYYWSCGDDRKWHRYDVPLQIGSCRTSTPTPTVTSSYGGGGVSFGGGGYGGPIGGPIGGGSGSAGGSYSTHGTVVVNKDKGCEPCQNALRNKMAAYSVSRLPAITGVWRMIAPSDYMPVAEAPAMARHLLSAYSGKLPSAYAWTGTLRRWDRIYAVAVTPLYEPCATTPAYVASYLRDLKLVADGANAEVGRFKEFFGDAQWLEADDEELGQFILAFEKYTTGAISKEALDQYRPIALSQAQLDKFVERWLNTINGANSDNVMSVANYTRYSTAVQQAALYAHQAGYNSVADFYSNSEAEVLKGLNEASNSVCSTISLELSQTMTMTREAFRATLTVDNSTDQPMTDIMLNIDIIDDEGRLATAHEFDRGTPETEGFVPASRAEDEIWTLPANTKGVARIVYTPTKFAAPDSARVYSFTGSLSYTDPYTAQPVSRDLFPVDMAVSPSPVLDMTYFMQRDVLGDDPLTEEVEPIIPAEFSLLINNVGNGDANNVKFITHRPEVTANDKGLYIKFDLLSSLLNGKEESVAIDGNVPTAFGTIPAHSTSYAQWYFTGSLLGHFLDYNVKVNHLTGHGNEDLSLLGNVTIHELIRSLDLSVADDECVTGFLVNDIADAEDTPDNLYVSDGSIETVHPLKSMAFAAAGPESYTLTVTADSVGWCYGHAVDPTAGYSSILKVTRRSDGKEVNLRNIWQTDRTLRDGKEPLYERLIHIADCLGSQQETYDVEFSPRPVQVLAVESFIGLPAEGEMLIEALDAVEVVFNKAIKPETFTTDDITLNCQGRQLDASQIGIEAVSDRSFRLDVSALTAPSGYYVLTVQTSGIADSDGFAGESGSQASWVQYIGGKVALSVTATPAEGGSATPKSGSFDIHSDIKLTATAAEGYEFLGWRNNGNIVSTSPAYTITLDCDESYVAEFIPKHYKVNVMYDTAGGSVSGAGSGIYSYGTCLSMASIAGMGWHFDGWKLNGEAHSIDKALDIDVKSDMDIEAVFSNKYRKIAMSLNEGWNWISTIFCAIDQEAVKALLLPYEAVILRVVGLEDELINDPAYGLTGSLETMVPSAKYKVYATRDARIDINGYVAMSEETPITMERGWNWIGYVPTQAFTLADALEGLNAHEGDIIKGFDSFATYADGAWQGTLSEMIPGQGYMYLSTTENEFVYPAVNVFNMTDGGVAPQHAPAYDGTQWSIISSRYPDNMAVIAQLCGVDNAQYRIGAFVGDECRGVSQTVNGRLFITVHGDTSDNKVTFKAINMLDGKAYSVAEGVPFSAGNVGSYSQPVQMHITGLDSIDDIESPGSWSVYPNPAQDVIRISGDTGSVTHVTVYALSGVKVVDTNEYSDASGIDVSALPAGLYLIEISAADGKHIYEFIKK